MEKVFADVIKVLKEEIILDYSVSSKSNNKYLHKRQRRERHRPRAEDYVKMEADIGVTHLQTKVFIEPPELAEAGKDSPLEPLERALHCQHLDFRLLTFRL